MLFTISIPSFSLAPPITIPCQDISFLFPETNLFHFEVDASPSVWNQPVSFVRGWCFTFRLKAETNLFHLWEVDASPSVWKLKPTCFICERSMLHLPSESWNQPVSFVRGWCFTFRLKAEPTCFICERSMLHLPSERLPRHIYSDYSKQFYLECILGLWKKVRLVNNTTLKTVLFSRTQDRKNYNICVQLNISFQQNVCFFIIVESMKKLLLMIQYVVVE